MRHKAVLALCGLVFAAIGAGATLSRDARAENEPVYTVQNGLVDQHTFNGYRRYGESCHRCHGPDGAGSSYAPALTESLKNMDYDAFVNTVVNGRQNVSKSQNNVMPAFGTSEDVVLYIDDIYGYLKARSDDKLPRGRPKRIGADAAAAQRAELISRSELRVCADPRNLPFSSEAKDGFENRIAEIVGADLELPVSYVWFPQVTGFVRNTLRARECDLVMGAVTGDGIMDSTNPYYHTGYMLVTRTADGIAATSVGDPVLRGKRFGVIAATPPTDLLLRHGLMGNVRAYSLRVDTRISNPARDMLQDLVDDKIDVALVWGPVAGYAIKQGRLQLTAAFIEPEQGAPRLDYRIAMGVRAGEPEWRRRINQAIGKHKTEIAAVLADYGVPQLDEQGRPAVP